MWIEFGRELLRLSACAFCAIALLALCIVLVGCQRPAKVPPTGTVCADKNSTKLVLRRWIPGSAAAGYPLVCAEYRHSCTSGHCEAVAP